MARRSAAALPLAHGREATELVRERMLERFELAECVFGALVRGLGR
jgi:hypothetical protein